MPKTKPAVTEAQAKAAWAKGDHVTWSNWWWANRSKAAKKRKVASTKNP